MPITYKTMVREVLQALNCPRGASFVAIRAQCNRTYDRDFASGIVDWRLKRALHQLVDLGDLKMHARHRRSYVLVKENVSRPSKVCR